MFMLSQVIVRADRIPLARERPVIMCFFTVREIKQCDISGSSSCSYLQSAAVVDVAASSEAPITLSTDDPEMPCPAKTCNLTPRRASQEMHSIAVGSMP